MSGQQLTLVQGVYRTLLSSQLPSTPDLQLLKCLPRDLHSTMLSKELHPKVLNRSCLHPHPRFTASETKALWAQLRIQILNRLLGTIQFKHSLRPRSNDSNLLQPRYLPKHNQVHLSMLLIWRIDRSRRHLLFKDQDDSCL